MDNMWCDICGEDIYYKCEKCKSDLCEEHSHVAWHVAWYEKEDYVSCDACNLCGSNELQEVESR